MTLRHRIIVAMIPLFALLVALGGTATISDLSSWRPDRSDTPRKLRQRDLHARSERGIGTNRFVVPIRTGRAQKKDSHEQYQDNWKSFDEKVIDEQQQHHSSGRRRSGREAGRPWRRYRQQGDKFFASSGPRSRSALLRPAGSAGLVQDFSRDQGRFGQYSQINQDNMEKPTAMPGLARSALLWYGAGLALGIVLALLLMASTIRTIFSPIRAATESAAAIGAGNLDQLVPINSEDELGQLAMAFNNMARQLREFSKIAQGPIDPGAADQPGHDRFFPRSGAGGRSATAGGIGESRCARLLVGTLPEKGEVSPAGLAAARVAAAAVGRCAAIASRSTFPRASTRP